MCWWHTITNKTIKKNTVQTMIMAGHLPLGIILLVLHLMSSALCGDNLGKSFQLNFYPFFLLPIWILALCQIGRVIRFASSSVSVNKDTIGCVSGQLLCLQNVLFFSCVFVLEIEGWNQLNPKWIWFDF